MEFVHETNRAETDAKSAPSANGVSEEMSDPSRTYLIERVKGGFFKPTIYSIRPILNEEAHKTGSTDASDVSNRLWARMHTGQKNHFTISGDIEDLSKPRKSRGSKFVGKLQVDHPRRVYRGWAQAAADDVRSQLVSVVYDHERMASVDFKMELGLPVTPTPNFHDDFMEVYRDGTQNLHKTDTVLVLMQGDDSHNMATEESLKTLRGTATVVSTKNFNLIKAKPIRGSRYVEEKEKENGSAPIPPVDEDEGAFMCFGKLSEDKFSCRFRQPIDMTTAFMIILSRFDTTQKYE